MIRPINLPRPNSSSGTDNMPTPENDHPDISFDAEHGEYVTVPVNRGKHTAKISPEDYGRLKAAGWLERWYVNSNGTGSSYVRSDIANRPESKTTIARLILGAGPGDVVRYRRNDRLDLRRSNIYIANREAHVARFRDHDGDDEATADAASLY